MLYLGRVDTLATAKDYRGAIKNTPALTNIDERIGITREENVRAARRHAHPHISPSTAHCRRKWCPEEDSNLHDLAIAST
jgi:hypothetical protein